MNIYTVH
jgi:hypothetical protein